MPVDWKSKDSYTRLLAAMVAATPDMKLDYRKIASFYGQGATYDAIEGRFRVIKKEAAVLKSEIDDGVRPEAPVRGNGNANGTTPKKPRTPKKSDGSLDGNAAPNTRNRRISYSAGVLSGRVTKSSNSSPSKRRSAAQIKQEMHSGSTSSTGDMVLPGMEDGDADGFADFDPSTMSFEMLDGVSSHALLGGNGVGIWDDQGV